MKAVVLAAGLGTRLGALTEDAAKPAIDVGGRPLVAHVVANLARSGFDEIAVNLHYRPDQIESALGDGSAYGVRIEYFLEPELLGTAGALGPMRAFLGGEPFLVHYGDVLTDHDAGALLGRHVRRGALVTLLVHERERSNSVVVIDGEGRVTRFLERPSASERRGIRSRWVNSGVYACDPGVLELVPEPPADMARDVVLPAVPTGRVFAEPLVGYRCAVDSPERLEEARLAVLERRVSLPLQ